MGGLGGDNMSIIIICFLHGKPWQDLVDKCKRHHSEKKASSKLSEPAFSAFDRFMADGPFAEVSVLKGSEELSNTNESSSSSHTSSPSSSPISTEEKFELIAESSSTKAIVAETIAAKIESEAKSEEEANTEATQKSQGDEIEVSKNASENILEPSATTKSSDDAIVSNGD